MTDLDTVRAETLLGVDTTGRVCRVKSSVRIGAGRVKVPLMRSRVCGRPSFRVVLFRCPEHGLKETDLCQRHLNWLYLQVGQPLCEDCPRPVEWIRYA